MRLMVWREMAKKRIEGLKELCEKYEDDVFKGRLCEAVLLYNLSFSVLDKRNKKWKCKKCGDEIRGVIEPKQFCEKGGLCDFEVIR